MVGARHRLDEALVGRLWRLAAVSCGAISSFLPPTLLIDCRCCAPCCTLAGLRKSWAMVLPFCRLTPVPAPLSLPSA